MIGLIGGAAAVGIPLLLKAFGGGGGGDDQGIDPQVQLQLLQSLGGGQGGRAPDPALHTGRELSNMLKLLKIIETLRDSQAISAQPGMGSLV